MTAFTSVRQTIGVNTVAGQGLVNEDIPIDAGWPTGLLDKHVANTTLVFQSDLSVSTFNPVGHKGLNVFPLSTRRSVLAGTIVGWQARSIIDCSLRVYIEGASIISSNVPAGTWVRPVTPPSAAIKFGDKITVVVVAGLNMLATSNFDTIQTEKWQEPLLLELVVEPGDSEQ